MTWRLAVPVLIGSEIFGTVRGILVEMDGRNLLVSCLEPIPLGSVVTVHFIGTRCDGQADEIVARATVRRLLVLNAGDGCDRLLGMTVLDFDDRPPLDLPGMTRLH